MTLYLFSIAAAISCYECGSMYDGTNFMGIKGYDQCQFFESDVILGASGEQDTDRQTLEVFIELKNKWQREKFRFF